MFPCCSTRKDLSIDVSITNVGLILTKLRWFQHFVKSQNLNFELFWKKSNFWVSMLYYSWRPFHWCINYKCRTDIDEAKVISAFRQKSKFEFRTYAIGIGWSALRHWLIGGRLTGLKMVVAVVFWAYAPWIPQQKILLSLKVHCWNNSLRERESTRLRATYYLLCFFK